MGRLRGTRAIPHCHRLFPVRGPPGSELGLPHVRCFERPLNGGDRNDVLKAVDPNLKKFFSRGGKLILYHGWSDNLIAPLNSVGYFNNVVEAVGGPKNAQQSVLLFMAPGMGHCGGGDGPNNFDMVAALEEWVEHSAAPERVIAAHRNGGQTDRTRPLCPYPAVAKYSGTGSIDDAANFVCSMPK